MAWTTATLNKIQICRPVVRLAEEGEFLGVPEPDADALRLPRRGRRRGSSSRR